MNKDYSDRIIFEGNRLIGYSPFITVNSQTETLTRGSNNYYAPYTEDFASAQNGTPLFGVLEGSDYYLDYAKTTLASSMDMVIDRKLAVVNNVTREASLVIGEDEDYYSDIKTSDGLNRYNLYSDEACLQSISTLNSEIVGDGTVVYAKTTNAAGVSVVYRVYVSVGDVNAAEPITVGEGKIDSPYLFCEETENMPHGTKFTVSWEGTEYVFTAGVNAFASVAQIIAAHGGDSVPNVIMPGGVYNGDVIATSSVNFYGENGSTVLTSEPDVTTPVKIACVGDAITEGNGLSEDERADKSYPAQLKSILDEKYGDVVRVVDMSGFSVEFCGGTHVKNTSEITALKIISESGVAAGVRRIEALTSEGLMNYYAEMERLLKEAAQLVKATPENLAEKITHLQAENKSLKGEVESLKSKMAQSAAGDILDQVKEVKGVKLLAAQLDGVDMNGLRDLGDQLKEKLGEGVVVLASGNDGKVSLMATATDGAMKQGAHAGNLVKAIAGLVGGGGGGRPNMAQAGGKNPAGIPDALAKAEEALADQIK